MGTLMERLTDRPRSRWLALFVISRAVAGLIAAVLLVVHEVSNHDAFLAALALAYSALSIGVAVRLRRRRPVGLWVADVVAALNLILAAGEWRSPFYLLFLTTLILPATSLARGRAIGFVLGTAGGYLGVALLTGVDWGTLRTTPRLESFATHLMLPVLMGVGLAYAAELLRRLRTEQARSERIALEAERRRLARELHDSAKQRIHAAQLLLTSLPAGSEAAAAEPVQLAIRELAAASSEMETSLNGLRTAAGGGTLLAALRGRPAQLGATAGVEVNVAGADMPLADPLATHVYHVLSEAILNAIRHARATTVVTRLRQDDGHLVATVVDNGCGFSKNASWNSQGVRSMMERAELVGGHLSIGPGIDGAGTTVTLDLPYVEQTA